MGGVFISYSRRDIAFARILHQALKDNGFETWIDWQDIPPSTKWLAEIYEAIEQADTFVFIISRHSVGSDVCRLEVDHARKNGKRLIPLVIDDVEPHKVTPELADLNWLFFREEDDFSRAFQDLTQAIQTDYAWVKEHTRLQMRALEWERKARDAGYLLRGRDLNEAETWLSRAGGKQPHPTDLHTEYLLSSRRAETRRLRLGAGATIAFILLIAASLLTVVVIQNKALSVSASRQLASASAQNLEKDLSLSLLLSAEAMGKSDTVEARSSLLAALNRSAYVETLLPQMTDDVLSLAWSPDGALLATGGSIGYKWLGGGKLLGTRGGVCLWHAETYRPNKLETDLCSGVLAVAFGPDGRWLAVGGSNARNERWASTQGSVELWDAQARTRVGPPLVGEIHELCPFPNEVRQLAFSPDGRWLAVSGSDTQGGTVTLWSVDGRQAVSRLAFGHWITGLAFSPDGRWLAVSSYVGDAVGLWTVDGGYLRENSDWQWEADSPSGLDFHPSGKMLAVRRGDGSISFHDTRTGAILGEPLTAGAGPRSSRMGDGRHLSFSMDGRYLAAPGLENHLIVWQVAPAEDDYRAVVAYDLVAPTPGTVNVEQVSFHPLSYRLASASGDGTLVLWNLDERHPLVEPEYQQQARSLAFAPDGSTLAVATAGNPGIVRLWDLATGQQVAELPPCPDSWGYASLAFSPDGETLIVGDDYIGGGKVYLWDVARNQPIASGLGGHNAPCQSVAFSPTGELAASSSLDGTIIFWDPRTGEPLSPPLCDVDLNEELVWMGGSAENGIWCIAFTPNGRVLASGRQDGTILLWSVAEQAPLSEAWLAHYGPVTALAVSPDGQILATGGGDYLIRLWDLATGAALGELVGHSNALGGLSFSPDGKFLASCGLYGGPLRLWDVESRRPLGAAMPEMDDGVYSVAFSPDGKFLASGRETITLWNIEIDMWLEQAIRIANRELTPEERELYLGDLP